MAALRDDLRKTISNAEEISTVLNGELPQTLRRIEASIETAATAVLLSCTVLALAASAIAIAIIVNQNR